MLIAGQVMLAFGFGVLGMIQATDPGWQDLQRLLIMMMVSVWLGAIVGTVLVARLVDSRVARFAILAVGPFALILVIGAWMMLANG